MTGFGLTVDRWRIAVRLRALLHAAIRRSGLRAVAADLDVSADGLQASVDLQNPHPSVEVLLAVICFHGVDPTWLLTGEYDLATHREALENPANALSLLTRTSLRRERALPLQLDDVEDGSAIGASRLTGAFRARNGGPPDAGRESTAV
jgi:hypothetical protein